MEVEIQELEKAIQYITHEIESCEAISCPSLKAISIRYLTYLRQKAMNKLAIEKNKALR